MNQGTIDSYLNWIINGKILYVNLELRQQMKLYFSFGQITGRFIGQNFIQHTVQF